MQGLPNHFIVTSFSIMQKRFAKMNLGIDVVLMANTVNA
jgi:hypothetical protein